MENSAEHFSAGDATEAFREPVTPMTLRIPRRLESPNTWNGRHWRVKHRISQDWEKAVGTALIDATLVEVQRRDPKYRLSLTDALTVSLGPRGVAKVNKQPWTPFRCRVIVERHVPSMRNFIRDDDNLRFSVKPLLDALKRQGYIHNDSRKWLEHPTPTQHVSADGMDWTVLRIEAVGGTLETKGAGLGKGRRIRR